MGTNGKGAIAFTVMGGNYYPSAGYVTIDADGNVGPVHIAAAGLGPDDGFTSYNAFVGDPPRTRWGDYGAAVTDGSSIWIASEYIAQTCTLQQYLTGAIGSCNGTRTSLANWATWDPSKVTPEISSRALPRATSRKRPFLLSREARAAFCKLTDRVKRLPCLSRAPLLIHPSPQLSATRVDVDPAAHAQRRRDAALLQQLLERSRMLRGGWRARATPRPG